MTPQEYAQKVRDLKLEDMKIRDTSPEDALNDTQESFRNLEHAETELYRLKRLVKADINAEWEVYHAHAKALETSNAIWDFLRPLIFGRRSSRSWSSRRYKKQGLHDQREENLAIYRKVESELNHLLDKVIITKKILETSLANLRRMVKDSEQIKCLNCGQFFLPRLQNHKLCYDCYKRTKEVTSSTSATQASHQSSLLKPNEQKCIQCGKPFVARASYHRICYPCYRQNQQS